eukprot:CAMPEP_0202960500 /NCGR_PEP_ID=MMETSP1396-20130829/4641_1 /ASSEMBLY_ACC=CAM_ASM_000872 /TAXON_ID= /ORGANISM="Pseudokeronopsis sp., Strain Brazil" /LENGTH=144 /DNA_ID=CAMNT_0049679751 /DNA_START=567 /DNA_END=1000 /DNA_ORIENTATION=+
MYQKLNAKSLSALSAFLALLMVNVPEGILSCDDNFVKVGLTCLKRDDIRRDLIKFLFEVDNAISSGLDFTYFGAKDPKAISVFELRAAYLKKMGIKRSDIADKAMEHDNTFMEIIRNFGDYNLGLRTRIEGTMSDFNHIFIEHL